MLIQRIVVGLLAAAVAGVFSLGIESGKAGSPPMPADVTILLGEVPGGMYIAVEGGPRRPFPPGTAMEVITTIRGAADGEITILFRNTGHHLHEILTPLFMTTTYAEAWFFDAQGRRIGKAEAASFLEIYLEPGVSARVLLQLADTITDSLAKDPALVLTFEIACHIAGHYEAGQRALIAVAH